MNIRFHIMKFSESFLMAETPQVSNDPDCFLCKMVYTGL